MAEYIVDVLDMRARTLVVRADSEDEAIKRVSEELFMGNISLEHYQTDISVVGKRHFPKLVDLLTVEVDG